MDGLDGCGQWMDVANGWMWPMGNGYSTLGREQIEKYTEIPE